MARLVLIAVLFTFLFIQLASSQDTQACIDAGIALGAATQCQGNDRSVVCAGECRELATAFFDACGDDETTQQAREAYNQVCGGAGVLKGLGIYSLLLVSLAAAVIF